MNKITKNVVIAGMLVLSAVLFLGCPLPDSNAPISNSWNLSKTEIWWGSPDYSTTNWPTGYKISEVPFGETILDKDGWAVTYSGSEYNFKVTQSKENTTLTVVDTWDHFPATIYPEEQYPFTLSSVGDAMNGIGLSHPVKPGYYWSSQLASYRQGPQTGMLELDAPADKTTSSTITFVIGISSGKYYWVEYRYFYDWIP